MDLSSFRGRGRVRVVAGIRRNARRRPSVRPAAGDNTAPAQLTEGGDDTAPSAGDNTAPAQLTEGGDDTAPSPSVTNPTIVIKDLFNFKKRLLDVADKNLYSPVDIDIRDMITDKEYDIIKKFVEDTNDNLKRTALKIKTERLGKEVVGLAKGFLKSFRSAEKKTDQYKRLVGNEE